MDLQMKDIMDEEKLRTRFDIEHASHITALWRRTAEALNSFLQRTDCRVFWQCEEITVPFKNVEDAPLISLLSEGDHPTDGNDYLFIIINAIVGRYNTFVRWLGEFEANQDHPKGDENALHPKFVVRGSYGAVATSTVVVLPESELDLLVESAWDSTSQMYNISRLEDTLRHELALHVRRPMLMNPLEYLRERFSFREDAAANAANGERSDSISMCRNGNYFANVQDVQLYNSVSELVNGFTLEGSTEMRRTLEDTFHSFDYNRLRSLLEGIRNILQLLRTEGIREMAVMEEMLCTAFRISREQLASESFLILGQLGFPEVNKAQSDLLLSLQSREIVELVRFAGFQLASEAYLFSELPLCLKEPLGVEEHRAQDAAFKLMKAREGLETTLGLLDEFVLDVLSYYEKLICREVLSSTQTFRAFLLKNNCCDSSDPFFTLIPPGLTLRNYVSLRCHLHQKKLSSLFHEGDVDRCVARHDEADMGDKPVREQSWLWDENETISETEEDGIREQVLRRSSKPLWFLAREPDHAIYPEESMTDADAIAATHQDQESARFSTHESLSQPTRNSAATPFDGEDYWDVHSVDDESNAGSDMATTEIVLESENELAAQNIQRWWRRSITTVDRGEVGGQFLMDDWETTFRLWLKNHRLPQSVGDVLIGLGAHDVADVAMLLEYCEDDLQDLKLLDRVKLREAVQAQTKTEEG
jgi:hypothetical protein